MFEYLIEKMGKEILTGHDFEAETKDFLYNMFHEKVKLKFILEDKDGKQFTYGDGGDNKPQLSKDYKLVGDYKVCIKVWQENHELNLEECEKLFDVFWNKVYCDELCGLPITDDSLFIRKCDYTINEWQKAGKSTAVVMIDLDNFKKVNSTYGHKIGSEVISEFSRVLFNEVNKKGILIHQSGDEFNILFTFESHVQILDFMYSIYKVVRAHKFSVAKDIDLTMAIGVWVIDPGNEVDFLSIRDKAEEAYEPRDKNGTKQRNSIRINKNNNLSLFGDNILETGLLRVWSNLNNNQVFHNVYLDYISYLVSKINLHTEIQSDVNKYLEWINPKFDSNLRITNFSEKWDTSVDISYIDIGFAILKGLLKNNIVNRQSISFQIKNNNLSIKINDDEVINFSHTTIIGDLVWTQENYCIVPENTETRKTVLVQAGYSTKFNLPEDIFYRIVRVDARPFIGGGLPDLWTATLSSLINCMKANVNFKDIVVFGDLQNTSKVMYYLNSISNWDNSTINYISKKIYKSDGDIRSFKEAYQEHIFNFSSEEEMIKHIYEIHKNINALRQTTKLDINTYKRFMIRNLPYENLQLEITDGFRTDTISHAYPIALEILRKKIDGERQKTITDQAGRELLELVDFKISLETPQKGKLPEYYFYDEKMLDNYYENVFINEEGLFRKRLKKDNQLEEMIKHVIGAISGENTFATRRAILIVQNEIQGAGNYSPLGLVAIWLAPRFVGKKVLIDYSYTWRTVEAIVGLPLSLYASVKFAEHLTEKIAENILAGTIEVEMGQVSYIAHSLHMFTDEESMNIVRGIINEVSI